MTEAMPFLQKYDITFLRPPTILRQDFVHLPWRLAVLLGDLLCFPPLGRTVFHTAAIIGLRIVVDEKRKPVNCRKD